MCCLFMFPEAHLVLMETVQGLVTVMGIVGVLEGVILGAKREELPLISSLLLG